MATPTPRDDGPFRITLRDYFAASALPECIRLMSFTTMLGGGAGSPWIPPAVQAAYAVADAMLAAREK